MTSIKPSDDPRPDLRDIEHRAETLFADVRSLVSEVAWLVGSLSAAHERTNELTRELALREIASRALPREAATAFVHELARARQACTLAPYDAPSGEIERVR